MHLDRARILFALGATALAFALVAGLSPAARGAGETSAAPVTGGSWYWAEQLQPIDVSGGQPGHVADAPTPDVPQGDFAVAVKGGQPDKVTALHIDTSAIPTGSTVSSFTLTLKEDAGAPSVNQNSADIHAYAATDFFADGSQGQPLSQAPSYDTHGPSAVAKRSDTGAWTFDLQPIVEAWVSGSMSNNGIVIAPGADPGQNFEVVWSGAQPPPVTEGAFTAPEGSDSSFSSGSSSGSDTSGGGSFGGGSSTGTISPDFSTPVSAPSPSGTPTAPPTTPARPLALGRLGKVNRAPPLAFYLAALGILALVGGCMVSLGDAGEPVIERRGSVMRTLERRNPSAVEES